MLHVICERDVGLFSLVQQVISNIPWALAEGRVPVAYFRDRTCYWSPTGHAGRATVWEYYFEPLIETAPAETVPDAVRRELDRTPPSPFEVGRQVGESAFVTAHFGDHPDLAGKALPIPFEIEDPTPELRQEASEIIRHWIRPRAHVREAAESFHRRHFDSRRVIGVHVRGTDAVSDSEVRAYRRGSLSLPRYLERIEALLSDWPDARVFVGTDSRESLDWLRERLGARVIWRSSILHETGEPAGEGPTGWIMPAYIAADRRRAAQNGEEAVIDYLLLGRCHYLIHNGASLARTVLLKEPGMPHSNTHGGAGRPSRRAGVVRRRLKIRDNVRRHRLAVGDADDPVPEEVIARVKAEKARRRALGRRYVDFPRIGFVVQSFNRAANIANLYEGLSAIEERDLIVCDDGSIDGSRAEWMKRLDAPNDFMILSNDLHEIRVLDRAIRFSRADIVCIVQDDDTIPRDPGWVHEALARFDRHPELAVLGGFMGFRAARNGSGELEVLWGPQPFTFALHVNIGPYFVRRAAYEALGGWDYAYSRVGEPGICFDNELCFRAWQSGYRVAYRFVPFKGAPGCYTCDGGTALFGGTRRRINMRRNLRAIERTYGATEDALNALVEAANAELDRGGRGATEKAASRAAETASERKDHHGERQYAGLVGPGDDDLGPTDPARAENDPWPRRSVR